MYEFGPVSLYEPLQQYHGITYSLPDEALVVFLVLPTFQGRIPAFSNAIHLWTTKTSNQVTIFSAILPEHAASKPPTDGLHGSS